MSALLAAVDLFAFFYVLFLPSYILGRALAPQHHALPRFLLGALTVLLTLPLMSMLMAAVLDIAMNTVLLYTLASLCILAGAFVQLRRYRRRTRVLES